MPDSKIFFYLPGVLVPAAVSMGAVVIYSRLLSTADYGRYALTMTAVNIALALASRWLIFGVTRLLPAARANATEAHFVATAAACFAAMLGAGLSGIAGLFVWRAAGGHPGGEDLGLALIGLAIFGTRSLVVMANAMHRARLAVTRYAAVECGQALAGFGASLLAIRLWGPSAEHLLMGTVLGFSLLTGIELLALLPWLRAGRPDRVMLRQLVGFSGPLTATAALSLMLVGCERLLLQGFLGASAVGVYSAVTSIADRSITLMFSAVTMALFPLTVRALETEGTEACRQQQRHNVGVVMAVTLPTAVGIAITAPQLTALLLGPAFREAASALLPWLAASTFIARTAIDVFDHAFYLSRRTGLLFVTLGPALAFSVAGNAVFIPTYGLLGAAWVSVGTAVLMLGLSAGIGARVLPVPVPVDALIRVAGATLAMALTVVALPHDGGAWGLARQVSGGVAAYAMACLTLNVLDSRRRLLGWLRRSLAVA